MRLPSPMPMAGGRPLADAVEGQDRGLLERDGKERAGGVAFVMLGEDKRCARRPSRSLAQHAAGMMQLVLEPDRHGQAEAAKARSGHRPDRSRAAVRTWSAACRRRRRSRVCSASAGLFEAISNRRGPGKPASCFLRLNRSSWRRRRFAIDDQGGGAVVIKGRDSENGGHTAPVLTAWSNEPQASSLQQKILGN